MGSSYTWHSGSPALGSRWTFNVPLYQDELLSSWLIRVSLKHACNPLSLTNEIWPDFRVWTLDLDRGISAQHLQKLSTVSGINEISIANTFLSNFVSEIYPNKSLSSGIWPWILSIGIRNRRYFSGVQTCSECLKEPNPYFKIQSRFAWHTVCEKHETLLTQRCPHCNSLINPINLEYFDKNLSICSFCKESLFYQETYHNNCSVDSTLALQFQQTSDQALIKKEVYYGEHKLSVSEWFQLCRFLVNIQHKNSRFTVDLFSSGNKHTQTGLALEMLSINDRFILFNNVQKSLSISPTALMKKLGQAYSYSVLNDPRICMPVFLKAYLPIHDLSGKRRIRGESQIIEPSIPKPKSRIQVQQKWRRLMRKHHLNYEDL